MTKINDGEPSRRVRQRAACARLVASAVWFATPLPLLVNWIGPAEAEAESRVVANPPLLEMQQGAAPKSTLMALPNASRLSTEKQLDLNIVYTDSKIYNPGTGRDDKVRTRREGSPSLIFVIRTSPTPWVFPAGYRKARGEKDFGTSRDVGAFDYQGGQRGQEQPLWRQRYARHAVFGVR